MRCLALAGACALAQDRGITVPRGLLGEEEFEADPFIFHGSVSYLENCMKCFELLLRKELFDKGSKLGYSPSD